jgi:hypothetical protein
MNTSPPLRLSQVEVGDLADIAQLTSLHGWTVLQQHYRMLADRQKQDWGEALYRGDPPEEAEAAFRAGFWEGALAVLDTPSRAEDRLERELKRRKATRSEQP